MSSNTQALQLIKNRLFSTQFQRVQSTKYDDIHRSETFDSWHKADNATFKKNLTSYNQITINNSVCINSIGFDVDEPEAFILPDTAPSMQVYNNDNDKNHTSYVLKNPIYVKSEKQKNFYDTIIRPAIVKVTFLLNADVNYKNTTTKNPFNESLYRVKATNNILDSVWDLLAPFNDGINALTTREANNKKDGRYISKKYRAILGEFIEHSQMNSSLLFSDIEEYKNVMDIKADLLKANSDYSDADIDKVCNDAIARSLSWAKEISKQQSFLSKRRWGDTVEQNKINITNAIVDILARGFKPTIKNISMCVNLAEPTLKRYYAPFIKSEKARLKTLI